jgi:hypothetical protein
MFIYSLSKFVLDELCYIWIVVFWIITPGSLVGGYEKLVTTYKNT